MYAFEYIHTEDTVSQFFISDVLFTFSGIPLSMYVYFILYEMSIQENEARELDCSDATAKKTKNI